MKKCFLIYAEALFFSMLSAVLSAQNGNIQGHIADGVAAAGVHPAKLFVCCPTAIAVFRDVHIAGDQTGMAPAAFTAAAVGRGTDAGLLQGIQQGLICPAGNPLATQGHSHSLQGLAS